MPTRPRDPEPHVLLGVARDSAWTAVRNAYWKLARQFHPDGSAPDAARMAAINSAYEQLERQRRSDSGATRKVAVGPGASGTWPATASESGDSTPDGTAVPPHSTDRGGLMGRMAAARQVDSPLIDFGQYAGWRIADVAVHDPRYLRWLSRHSSGARYHDAIIRALGPDPEIGRRPAVVR